MKIRARIATAVLARLDAVKPHKEAARRASAFLMLPMNAALGLKLLYQTVDAMWRARATHRPISTSTPSAPFLGGVYSATLLRWFNDTSEDESETRAFLDARIENVMQFEKFKAELRERTKDWPSFADIVGARRR